MKAISSLVERLRGRIRGPAWIALGVVAALPVLVGALVAWPLEWHLGVLAALIVFQAIVIAGQLVEQRRLEQPDVRFREAVDAAPHGMLLIAASGKVVLANEQLLALFGYSARELAGDQVEMLLPQRYRAIHPALRHGYFSQPEIRHLGRGRDLVGLRKDVSEFPLEIGLSPLGTGHGQFVLVSVIDLSERRRVERKLRENREELRRLAAQILGVQETERRRIARELHDDFGQELALIAVELDLYRQRLPADAAQGLEAIWARVKELLSAVHDLSHQLHPLKLEQLGLVSALRGLCKEISLHQGLAIDFTNDELPTLPPLVALCLYRIAQEALRNIVKHSGASCACVALRVREDSIFLEISDTGDGFDPAEVGGRAGLGLVSMRERLRLVSGELTIDSAPGSGTRLSARAPLGASDTPEVESSVVMASH